MRTGKVIVILLIAGFILGCNLGTFVESGEGNQKGLTGTTSKSASPANASGTPIIFKGEIHQFMEEVKFIPVFHFVMHFWATVETDTGVSYELHCWDWEPPADPSSDWKNYVAIIETSKWEFGDQSRTFEATGKVTGTQWFVFPPGAPDEHGTPTLGRLVGRLNITGGMWEDKTVVGGQVSYNFTMGKGEYFEYNCDPDHPCDETASGIIKGVIKVR